MLDEPIYGAGLSFVGKYRAENQDAIRLHPSLNDPDESATQTPYLLYAIADGMGGYSHGGVASRIALETFFDVFHHSKPGKPAQILRSAMQQANTAVYQESFRLGSVKMGTTLTAACIAGSTLHIAHVGDCRVYRINAGCATCVTDDHTHVADMVRSKILSPDKVRTHNQRSVLTRCLGVDLFTQPDVTHLELERDDYIILCTDGVWSVIEDDEFGKVVHEIKDPDLINQRLITLAMERDSDDNASAITLHIRQTDKQPAKAHNQTRVGLGDLLKKRLFSEVGVLAKHLATML